jgi:fatty-acyl-CoA synthase
VGGRRVGLYYALINTHLTAEAAYIVNNSGARADRLPRHTRCVRGSLAYLPSGVPALRLIADDDLDG